MTIDWEPKSNDQAVRRGEQLATLMGSGWKSEVWENLGWHYAVEKGVCRISLSGRGYIASFNSVKQMIGTGETAPEALRSALVEVRRVAAQLQIDTDEVML